MEDEKGAESWRVASLYRSFVVVFAVVAVSTDNRVFDAISRKPKKKKSMPGWDGGRKRSRELGELPRYTGVLLFSLLLCLTIIEFLMRYR